MYLDVIWIQPLYLQMFHIDYNLGFYRSTKKETCISGVLFYETDC